MLKEGADPIPITYILKEGENTQEVPCNLVFIRDEGTSPNDNAIEINSGKGITMRILHSSLPTLQRDPANLGLEKSIYECRLSDTQAMNFVCEQDVIHWKVNNLEYFMKFPRPDIAKLALQIIQHPSKKTKQTVPLTEIKFDRSQSSDFKQRLIDIIDGNCNASPEQRYDSNSLAQNGHQKEALNPSDSSENTSSYDEEGSSEVVEDLDKSEIQNEDSSNLPDFEFVNDEQKPQQDVAQSEPIQPKSSNKDDVEFDDEEDEQLFTDSDLSKKRDEILEKMFCNNKDEKGFTNLTNDEISSLLAQIDTDTLEETLSEELEAGMSHMNETQKEEAMMSQDKKSYFLKRLRHEFQDDEDDDEILHKSGQISQRNAISFLTTQREIEESDSGSGSEGNLSMNARVPNPPQHPVPLPEPKRENLAAIIEALTKFRGMDKMIFLNFFSRFGSRYLEALKGIFFPMEADRETNKDDLAKCCQIIVCFIKICDRDLLMLLLRRDNYYLTFGALEYSSKAQLNKVNYRSHVNDPTKYKHLNSLGLQKYRDQAEYLYRLVYLKRILIYHDFDDVLMGFLSSCEIIMSADLIRAITCDKEIFRKLLDIEPIDEENEEEGQQVEDHDVRKAKIKFFMEIMTFLKGIPNPMMKSQVISKVNGENRLINVLMNLLKAPLFNLVEFEERRIKMCQSEDDYKSTHLRTLEICFKPYYEIPVKINELVTLALEVFLGVNALDACSTHKMILTRYSIEKKSTLFEDLGFILLHTRDEIIKDQVYAFMCSIVETIPPFDDCRRIASLFLGTTLFNFFIPYLDQPETIISAHREDYHVTTSIICKLLRMCLNKSREVHVVNRIANTKMMWNLSKLYSYAAKHIKIEVIKLVKFLILTPDEQMGETIIESDILPKIILTLRESAENQGILFCLVSGMIKSMISQNRAKLCKYITHFLFKGNALDDGVMHFMEPLKAVEENNSKLAHDADIGKETTSNTNALSKAGIPWSSNKNPPVETKDTPNPDLLEYTPLPETKEQKSKSSGIPKNRLENINKKEVKSYFDILALQGLVRCSQPSKFFDPNSEEEKKQKEIIKKGAFGFSSKRGKNGAFNTTPPVEFDKRIEIKPRTENNNKDLEIVRENFETSDTPTLPKNSASISESGLGCLSTESQNLIQQRESGANDQMKIRPCEIEQKVLDKASNNAHEGSQAQQIEVRNTTGLPKHDQEGQTISKNDANTVEIIEDPSKLIVSNEGSEVKLTNSQTTSKSIQISAQVVPEHEILTDQSPNQHLLQEQIQNSSVRNEDDCSTESDEDEKQNAQENDNKFSEDLSVSQSPQSTEMISHKSQRAQITQRNDGQEIVDLEAIKKHMSLQTATKD